jgi:hypothetical protein
VFIGSNFFEKLSSQLDKTTKQDKTRNTLKKKKRNEEQSLEV